MDEQAIQRFWQDHACGDAQIGGLAERYKGDYEQFFADYDEFKYQKERHIPRCIQALNVNGKRVLEIGLGEGSESELLIREGADWSGIDLTSESVERVRARLELRGLPYSSLGQGSVLDLPFADNTFDLLFSHGVLHHVPEIHLAQSEMHRVLRPAGELVIMLYARWSLNYIVSIALIRRLALLSAYSMKRIGVQRPGSGMITAHIENARTLGLARYLNLSVFTHYNTDGPANPYAVVYDRRRIERDFPAFTITGMYKRFMHAPPLPVHRLPGQALMGWHLWVHMRPTVADGLA